MNCLLCKNGTMQQATGTYFAQLKHGYVIIENVPCWQCGQCGEVVYTSSVMEKIEDILANLQKISSKIFLVDYREAA